MTEMTDAELRTRIAELEEERFRLKFRSATETLEYPLRLRSVRKDIARLQTVLRQRVLGVTPARAPKPARSPKGKTATKRAAKSAARR
jgi:large subunit ribosomal protein L29